MSTIEQSRSADLNPEEARTVKRLEHILVQSFRHSQGSVPLQESIMFLYALEEPETQKIFADHATDILQAVAQRCQEIITKTPHTKYTKPNELIDHKRIVSDVQDTLDYLGTAYTRQDRGTINKTDTMITLLEELLDQEIFYIENPRPHEDLDKTRTSALRVPIQSYLCYFGFEEHTTGSSFYDGMYEEVVTGNLFSQKILSRYEQIHVLGQCLEQTKNILTTYYPDTVPLRAQNFLTHLQGSVQR
jgi:hypothetical protein